MHITAISYERLHSFGDYNNERFRAEATLPEEEDPAAGMHALVGFINNQIAEAERLRSEAAERENLAWELLHGRYARVQVGDALMCSWFPRNSRERRVVTVTVTEKLPAGVRATDEEGQSYEISALALKKWAEVNPRNDETDYDPFAEE